MAEAALLIAISKIGIAVAAETLKYAKPLLAKRAGSVSALPEDMTLIRSDLELIQAFLIGTGTNNGWTNKITEAWIRQVRTLAYDMEDSVDQFIYIVGKHHREGSWWAYVKKIIKKPQSLFTLDEIATAVRGINKRLNQLKQNRDWTQPIGGNIDSIPATDYESQYVPGQDNSIADDELVGFDKNTETLINTLQRKHSSHLRIIALWGMGGIGKSTIVNNVYKNESSNFECHAWVSVSQSYKLDDIWRSMLKEIYAKDKKEFDAEKMNSAELQVELKEILERKRYLIVLDDVWRAQDIFQIKKVLVDNSLGSRVITTTRIEEVASTADDGCKIKLEPLCGDDAWRLFCMKAFPRIENHICPTELLPCGKEIVEKCGGLPLALVAIGSILSLQVQTGAQWKLFYQQLNWELHNNENLTHVGKILNLSYKYLPSYLKSCFLYCSMFPEDYLIHRKKLIRLWMAEGFVEQRGQTSLVDVAEGYLTELVRRSMLHVVERNRFDRIRSLRMHDLVRELAIFQSKRESFSTTYDDTNGLGQVESESRRVSVLRCKDGIRSSINPSRLRTFIAFDTSMAPSAWTCFIPSESKYLAVLDLSGSPIEAIPNSVGDLFNLKYFGLDDTKVKQLPKSFTKLHNLETLSLRGTDCLNLPKGSEKLRRLRNILIWKWLDRIGRIFATFESMVPFEGVWNLKELQTLSSVQASKVLVAKLGNLCQLRSLCITDVTSRLCAQLCDSLSTMYQLSKLEIQASDEDEVLQLQTMTLPCPLNRLALTGRLSQGTLESPFFSTHGNELRTLLLCCCHLAESPLPRLSELSNLTCLVLRRAYTGQELNFNAQWFPNLKFLNLWFLPHVNQICIQEGALVRLEELHMSGLVELRDFPTGLEYLKSLKRAVLGDMHPDIIKNLQTAELHHIQIFY